jgi:hypothetical protein
MKASYVLRMVMLSLVSSAVLAQAQPQPALEPLTATERAAALDAIRADIQERYV